MSISDSISRKGNKVYFLDINPSPDWAELLIDGNKSELVIRYNSIKPEIPLNSEICGRLEDGTYFVLTDCSSQQSMSTRKNINMTTIRVSFNFAMLSIKQFSSSMNYSKITLDLNDLDSICYDVGSFRIENSANISNLPNSTIMSYAGDDTALSVDTIFGRISFIRVLLEADVVRDTVSMKSTIKMILEINKESDYIALIQHAHMLSQFCAMIAGRTQYIHKMNLINMDNTCNIKIYDCGDNKKIFNDYISSYLYHDLYPFDLPLI